jgi:hypothetical protein
MGDSRTVPRAPQKMMNDLEKTHDDYLKYLDESWGYYKSSNGRPQGHGSHGHEDIAPDFSFLTVGEMTPPDEAAMCRS